jgi:hypothetical protein
MTGKKIVEKFPLSTEVIREWALKKMVDSFTGHIETEDFEKFLLEKGVHLSQIIDIIDTNPRILFDIFDDHKIYINIIKFLNHFEYAIQNFKSVILEKFETRKQAELKAIIFAFSILEEQLFINTEQSKSNEIDYPNSQE